MVDFRIGLTEQQNQFPSIGTQVCFSIIGFPYEKRVVSLLCFLITVILD